MTLDPFVSNVIYEGLGIAASVLGPGTGVQYRVYRLNSATKGSVISSNSLVYPAFNCYMTRTSTKKLLENAIFDLVAFEAKCDGTKLQAGDILQEIGPNAEAGGLYAVAQVRYKLPIRVILIRVENTTSIERLYPGAGAMDQQSMSGPRGILSTQGYGGTTPGTRKHLMLDNGDYLIAQLGQGTLASVPVGLQPLNRVKDGSKLGLPTEFARTSFLAYIPPLGAYQPSELDILKCSQSDSYEIRQVYTSNSVGLEGSIVICEKTQT